MKYTISALVLLCASVLALTGCEKAPAGFPKVYPVEITVLDTGEPLDMATVVLNPKEGTEVGSFTSAGSTTDKGVAVIKTMWGTYAAKGAPEGAYIVSITRDVVPEETMTPDELAELTPDALYTHKAELRETVADQIERVPVDLRFPGSSPIEITVGTTGTSTLTVDINDYRVEEE